MICRNTETFGAIRLRVIRGSTAVQFMELCSSGKGRCSAYAVEKGPYMCRGQPWCSNRDYKMHGKSPARIQIADTPADRKRGRNVLVGGEHVVSAS